MAGISLAARQSERSASIDWLELLNEAKRVASFKEADRAASSMLKHPGKRSTKQTNQRSDHPHGDRPFLPNAINMFAHVRQLDPVVAALDLGYLGDRLTPQQYHKLRREIGIDQLDYGVELRRAIEEADLVVHEFWRMVVWRTVQIDVDFEHEGKSWEYFWRLASAARNGCSIGPEDFSSETQPRNLADWKSRLGKLDGFPVELWDLIVVKGGRHRLKLPPKKIRVFRMKPPGALA